MDKYQQERETILNLIENGFLCIGKYKGKDIFSKNGYSFILKEVKI